jgi:hypothetical protein
VGVGVAKRPTRGAELLAEAPPEVADVGEATTVGLVLDLDVAARGPAGVVHAAFMQVVGLQATRKFVHQPILCSRSIQLVCRWLLRL